jgi:single-stranded DNA-binding protein
MSDIATVVLSGVLAEAPKVKYTQQGAPMCELKLTQVKYEGKDGSAKSQTMPVTFWNAKAEEFMALGLQAGSYLIIQGSLNSKPVQSRNGGEFYNLSVAGFTWQVVRA